MYYDTLDTVHHTGRWKSRLKNLVTRPY